MNTKWERFFVTVAAAAILCGTSATAHGQVAGLVNGLGGSPLQDATVEVWDTYPSGSILLSGTSGSDGAFALGDPGVGSFDLRVRRTGYLPTVIRDLPDPIGNVIATLAPSAGMASSPLTMDCSGTASTFLGELIQPGDVIEALDGDNVYCGTSRATTAGHYLLHILGDAPGDDDEGAIGGESVQLLINGLDASPNVTFFPFGFIDQELTGASVAPGVTVTGPADLSGHPGDEVLATYIIKNTGSVSGTFDFSVAIDPADWVLQVIGSSPVTLDPGQSAQIDVLITAPARVPAITADLTMMVTSDSYAPANCGSKTVIDVQATGVNDNIGSGSLIPSQFALSQNYPNPFNPETVISFSILQPGNVRLEVFNILGQSVNVLIDGYLSDGPVSTVWDGRDNSGNNVASGIYFYRLSRGADALTRQMVLLR